MPILSSDSALNVAMPLTSVSAAPPPLRLASPGLAPSESVTGTPGTIAPAASRTWTRTAGSIGRPMMLEAGWVRPRQTHKPELWRESF